MSFVSKCHYFVLFHIRTQRFLHWNHLWPSKTHLEREREMNKFTTKRSTSMMMAIQSPLNTPYVLFKTFISKLSPHCEKIIAFFFLVSLMHFVMPLHCSVSICLSLFLFFIYANISGTRSSYTATIYYFSRCEWWQFNTDFMTAQSASVFFLSFLLALFWADAAFLRLRYSDMILLHENKWTNKLFTTIFFIAHVNVYAYIFKCIAAHVSFRGFHHTS